MFRPIVFSGLILALGLWTGRAAAEEGGALRAAVKRGHLSLVRTLLDTHSTLRHATDEEGSTLLHYAAYWGQIEVAELLITRGADVNIRNQKQGVTPLHFAAQNGHLPLVELLIKQGADVNATSLLDTTPLHYAAAYGQRAVAEFLIAQGANVNARTKEGKTPLHAAASTGSRAVVALLIAEGAEVNATSHDGKTPLDVAKSEQVALFLRLVPQVRPFLPPGARIIKVLQLDFEHDGVEEMAVAYTISQPENDEVTTRVHVFRYQGNSQWKKIFEETAPTFGMSSNDEIDIEKVKSSNNKEGVVVTWITSGAGTASSWYLLASQNHKISVLDPSLIKRKVLRARGYQDNGYNSITVENNHIIDEQPGYSRHTARCCPDKPTIEIYYRFTGSSIEIDSVKLLKSQSKSTHFAPCFLGLAWIFA